jgi:hypothetical protein
MFWRRFTARLIWKVCARQKRYDASTIVVILRNRMKNKEATARIKINKLLETAG